MERSTRSAVVLCWGLQMLSPRAPPLLPDIATAAATSRRAPEDLAEAGWSRAKKGDALEMMLGGTSLASPFKLYFCRQHII